MKASDNQFPKLLLAVQASAADTPGTGLFAVYAKSDGLYYVDDAGVEHAVADGASSGAWGAITGTLSDQTDLQTALDAKAIKGQLAGVNSQTGTSYTLVLSDAGKDVKCTNASAITLTVPPNSSVAFPTGTWLLFSQGGAGTVTATAGSGVTLNAANGAATTAQYDGRGLEYLGSDVWRVW